MSTRVFDRIVEADYLPEPATKLVITHCFSRCEHPAFWALLVIGKYYDSSGRVIWSTEVFLGQFSWLDDEESSSESGTESGTASDSDSEGTHSVVSSSEGDTESQDEQSGSDSMSVASSSPEQTLADTEDIDSDSELLPPPAFRPPPNTFLNTSSTASQGFWVDLYDPVRRRRVHRFIG